MKEGWEVKKLGDVCDIYQPKTISTSALVENGKYLVYGANGVIGKYDQYNHTESELLMTCRGATCGTINISEPYSWINGNAMVIHPIEGNITMSYLKYVLRGIDLSNVITGAAQPQITRQSLSPLLIPIPSLPEQSRIVEELDQLNNIIEKKRQQLNELDNLAQSIFYDMFGDPVTNEKGWEVRDFSKCYKLSSGDGLSAKNIMEGDFPVYGGNGIVGYHSDYNMDGEYIIIGRVGALCGNVRNVIGKAFITDNAFVLIKNVENINVYLLYLLKIHKLRQYAREAMQPVISNASLKNIRIILPPLHLQQLFAQKIEAIEKEKELIKQSIKETEELFNSRMDYYFG